MLDNMKMRTKLTLPFLGSGLIAAVMAAAGLFAIHLLSDQMRDVAHVHLPATEILYDVHDAQTEVLGHEYAMLAAQLPSERRRSLYGEFEQAKRRIEGARKRYEALPLSKSEAAQWSQIAAAQGRWWQGARGIRRADAAMGTQPDGRPDDPGGAADDACQCRGAARRPRTADAGDRGQPRRHLPGRA